MIFPLILVQYCQRKGKDDKKKTDMRIVAIISLPLEISKSGRMLPKSYPTERAAITTPAI